MFKKEKILTIVLVNTILSFVIDFIFGFENYWYLILVIELPIIAIMYFAMKGYKWAFILTFIYYYIRSFNFYFENFYLMTKNGINFEISVNSVAINVVSFIFFITLFYELQRKFNSKTTKIVRIIMSIITGLIVIAGLLTIKSKKYDEVKTSNDIQMQLDTISQVGIDYNILIPETWESAKNFNGLSLIALSPYADSLDKFKGNITIQVFTIPSKIDDPSTIAEQLYKNGQDENYKAEVLSSGKLTDIPDFYYINYSLSNSDLSIEAIMLCTIKKDKAYSITCTDFKESFGSNFENDFKPILKTFRVE